MPYSSILHTPYSHSSLPLRFLLLLSTIPIALPPSAPSSSYNSHSFFFFVFRFSFSLFFVCCLLFVVCGCGFGGWGWGPACTTTGLTGARGRGWAGLSLGWPISISSLPNVFEKSSRPPRRWRWSIHIFFFEKPQKSRSVKRGPGHYFFHPCACFLFQPVSIVLFEYNANYGS